MSDETPITYVKNAAETMRDVMAEFMPPTALEVDPNWTPTSPDLITTPKNREVIDVSNYRRQALEFFKPARRKGTARLTDLNSLIAWANRFKGETSALFANPDMTNPTLTCIADYHGPGGIDVDSPMGDTTARHCHHRAVYSFPLSEEWKAWTTVSNAALGKNDLGEFIEAQAKDIMDPTPAILKGEISNSNAPWESRLIETAQKIEGRYGQLTQLLGMSKQFQIHETSNLTVKTNRDTGEQEIQFLSEHKTPDGQPIKIPNLIIIAIPVFVGGAPYRMPVRFRYRKAGGDVRFTLSIYNPEKAFEAAFNEAIEQATNETELPTFMGTPES